MADLKDYCPECLEERNEHNPIQPKRLTHDSVILICDKCSFTRLSDGVLLTKNEVIKYGLPGEILDYMPLKIDDITPVLLLALHLHLSSKANPLLPADHDLSYVEHIINSSVHNDFSEQPSFSQKAFVAPARVYEDVRSIVTQHYENSDAPNMKKTVMSAFAKMKNFRFPDDVIAHYLSRT